MGFFNIVWCSLPDALIKHEPIKFLDQPAEISLSCFSKEVNFNKKATISFLTSVMSNIAKDMEHEEEMLKDIALMLMGFRRDRGELIPVLQEIQARHSYLSKDAIRLAADYLNMSPVEVYGVATFYNQFKFNPPGRHRIKVCLGTACHVKGGDIILENFERKLGIKDGETTPDREFSIESVACVGCCSLAPVAIVDDNVQGYIAPSRIEGIFTEYRVEKEKLERQRQKNDPE